MELLLILVSYVTYIVIVISANIGLLFRHCIIASVIFLSQIPKKIYCQVLFHLSIDAINPLVILESKDMH